MRFWRAIFKLRLSPVHALKMKILHCRGCLRSAMLPAPIPICRNMTFQHQPRHSVCHLRAHGITYMEDRACKKQKGVQNTHTHTQTRAQDICSAFTLADLILPKYAQQKKTRPGADPRARCYSTSFALKQGGGTFPHIDLHAVTQARKPPPTLTLTHTHICADTHTHSHTHTSIPAFTMTPCWQTRSLRKRMKAAHIQEDCMFCNWPIDF